MGDDAVAAELLLPPVEEAPGVVAVVERAESEVVGPCAADVEFVRVLVVLDRGEQVGGEYDVCLFPKGGDGFGKRLEQVDVRVDINDPLMALFHEVGQRPGFHGRVEFQYGVLVQEGVAVGQSELLERQEGKFVGKCLGVLLVAVDDDAVTFGLRMLFGNTLQQCARKVEVVVGYDGNDGERCHVCMLCRVSMVPCGCFFAGAGSPGGDSA